MLKGSRSDAHMMGLERGSTSTRGRTAEFGGNEPKPRSKSSSRRSSSKVRRSVTGGSNASWGDSGESAAANNGAGGPKRRASASSGSLHMLQNPHISDILHAADLFGDEPEKEDRTKRISSPRKVRPVADADDSDDGDSKSSKSSRSRSVPRRQPSGEKASGLMSKSLTSKSDHGGDYMGSAGGGEIRRSTRAARRSSIGASSRDDMVSVGSADSHSPGVAAIRPKLGAGPPSTGKVADLELEILQLEDQLKRARKDKKIMMQDHVKEVLAKDATLAIVTAENRELKKHDKSESLKKENSKLQRQVATWKEEHDKLAVERKRLLEANADLTKKLEALQQQMDDRDSSASDLLDELELMRKEAVRSQQMLDATLSKQKQKMEILDHENDVNKRRVRELELLLAAKK